MPSSRIVRALTWISLLGLGSAAQAQTVDLAGLWPHENGRSWTYHASWEDSFDGIETTVSATARLWLDGSGSGAGGVAVQYLWGDSGLNFKSQSSADGEAVRRGFLAPLWRARPDLRPQLESLVSRDKVGNSWPFLLLAPAGPNELVWFRATEEKVGDWRDAIADWSWIYLSTDLAVGARFTLELVPDLVEGVFLHAEVQSILPSMSVPAGVFEDVLVMYYRVDYGPQYYTNVDGDQFGPYSVETTGTVAFAMGEGPIHMEEQTQADLSGCPECPAGLVDEYVSHGELTVARRSVPVSVSSFGALKAAYER